MLFSTALVWVQCFLLVLSVPLEQRASSLPDLYEATIDELALGLDDGAFTSVHLVKAYLARIAEVDTSGAMLRAVIQTNPHALEQAAYCDDLRKKGTSLGPLHGIPVLVKE
jgi:amidase